MWCFGWGATHHNPLGPFVGEDLFTFDPDWPGRHQVKMVGQDEYCTLPGAAYVDRTMWHVRGTPVKYARDERSNLCPQSAYFVVTLKRWNEMARDAQQHMDEVETERQRRAAELQLRD